MTETGRSVDFETVDYLHRRVPGPRSVSVLRSPARQMPGDTGDPVRRAGGHRIRGSARRSTRTRRSRRATRWRARSPGMPFGPGESDDVTDLIEQHRGAGPDGRAHHLPGPTAAHPDPRPAQPTHHAEAPQGERRLHVAARRSSSSTRSSSAASASSSTDYAKPFSLLVIADLLGVPPRTTRSSRPCSRWRPSGSSGKEAPTTHNPLQWLNEKFHALHRGPQARAARGRADRAGAGQARGRLDARHRRRDEPVDVPVRGRHRDDDEAGELGGPLHRRQPRVRARCCARTAARSRPSSRRRCGWRARSSPTSGWRARPRPIGDVDVPAGTTVMLLPGACNRDERKFADPNEFRDRPAERPRADRLHPRRAFVPGSTAGPRRGPHLAGTHPRPDAGHHASPTSTTAPPGSAGTPTSRPSSCAA